VVTAAILQATVAVGQAAILETVALDQQTRYMQTALLALAAGVEAEATVEETAVLAGAEVAWGYLGKVLVARVARVAKALVVVVVAAVRVAQAAMLRLTSAADVLHPPG
jgi:hypothetical protein